MKVSLLAIAAISILSMTACEGTYPGMDGDGSKFHVYEIKSGMGQTATIATRKDISCGKQTSDNFKCATNYVADKN